MSIVVNIDAQSIEERFLRYVRIDTQSDPLAETSPSTAKQWNLLNVLKNELENLELSEVSLDAQGYLFAKLPARNASTNTPHVGFLAHIDTSPDASGYDVKPRIIPSYDGTDLLLSDGIVLSPNESPELLNYMGQRLIVTDGTTLLGADDKAGIAAIMEALRFLRLHPEISHAPLCIAFTPDEEIGRGVTHFDIEKLGADLAYTIDGGALGELSYENFNAARATIRFQGLNVHPGAAKNKMRNAARMAIEFDSMIGETDRPENTEDREGFFHLHDIQGNENTASLSYLIREFDDEIFQQRKKKLQILTEHINQRYGKGSAILTLNDEYHNMRAYLKDAMFVVEYAKKAFLDAGVTPNYSPIRGGTDGVRLTELGLPCPNIFAGGLNFHSIYEFLPIASMVKASEIIVRIANSFSTL
ncbi:MAG: peptidase T [Bacteroides sp.]